MLSRLWKDPVWSKVIASTVIAAAVAVFAYLRGLLPWVTASASNIGQWLSSTTLVTNWVLVLVGVLATLAALSIAAILLALLSPNRDAPNASTQWRNYRSGAFFDLRWRWQYENDGTVSDLHPYCLNCDYQIRPIIEESWAEPSKTLFPCDDCGQSVGPLVGSIYDIKSQVTRKIQKHLRNGTWADAES